LRKLYYMMIKQQISISILCRSYISNYDDLIIKIRYALKKAILLFIFQVKKASFFLYLKTMKMGHYQSS
jgi:hypothetical protein